MRASGTLEPLLLRLLGGKEKKVRKKKGKKEKGKTFRTPYCPGAPYCC
jgi:hypothetical protein